MNIKGSKNIRVVITRDGVEYKHVIKMNEDKQFYLQDVLDENSEWGTADSTIKGLLFKLYVDLSNGNNDKIELITEK